MFTYAPNDTAGSSALPFSNLIPAMLQNNHHDFVPHTFTVGDTFQTNFSLFSYGIISAYSRGGSPGGSPEVGQDIRSFEYMNYGFRTCDVVDLSLGINLLDFSDITAKASKRFFADDGLFFILHTGLNFMLVSGVLPTKDGI